MALRQYGRRCRPYMGFPLMSTGLAMRLQLKKTASSSPIETFGYSLKGLPDEAAGVRTEEYQIVNFYHLVDIADPDKVVREHREWIRERDIRGRIYFSRQGVNAQFTGTVEDTISYLEWMKTQQDFESLRWSLDPVDQHMFPRLRLSHKPNLVQLGGGMSKLPITNPEERAIPLNPDQWRAKLKEAQAPDQGDKQDDQPRPVVLDVRNGYEWDAGHFEGAARPSEESFSETPVNQVVPAPLKNATKDTPILMYCTGGIRCDIYSTVLRQKGFNNLYSLDGGVQKYFKEEGTDLWKGSLFVFDGRMAIHPDCEVPAPQIETYGDGVDKEGSVKELPAAGSCEICRLSGQVPHVNCANVDCNRLFIACESCKANLKGCCCEECVDAPRLLRPLTDGQYGKFGTYTMGRLKRSMSEGRERHLAKLARKRDRLRTRRLSRKLAILAIKRQIRNIEREVGEDGQESFKEAAEWMKIQSE